MSQISQCELNEVARYFENTNNRAETSENVSLEELLAMIKAPAVSLDGISASSSTTIVASTVATGPTIVASIEDTAQIIVESNVVTDPGVVQDAPVDPSTVVPSCDDSIDFCNTSKEYNKELKLFHSYIAELKCGKFNEANKNTLKNYVSKIEKIHIKFLHHVITKQDKIQAKNDEIITLQKQLLQSKEFVLQSEDKTHKKIEEKDSFIIELQQKAASQQSDVKNPPPDPRSNTSIPDNIFDENIFDEHAWETVKPKRKPRPEKPITYAEVAKIAPFELKIPTVTTGRDTVPKNTSHVLLLNSEQKSAKMEGTEFAQKREKIKSIIDAKSKKICIIDIAPTRSGGVLISFPSKDDLEKTKIVLDENEGDLNLKTKYPTKKLPKICIKKIDSSIPDNQIKNVILEQNSNLREELEKENSVFEKVFCKSEGHFKKSALFTCSPNIRALIMKCGYLYIDCNKCDCEDNLFIHQCLHCAGFGHTEKFCNLKSAVNVTCVHCSGSHRGPECPHKFNYNYHCCTNCLHSQNREISDNHSSHGATSKDCPIFIRELTKLSLRTDYGCDFVQV